LKKVIPKGGLFILLFVRSLRTRIPRSISTLLGVVLLTLPLLSGLVIERISGPGGRRGDYQMSGRCTLRLLPPSSDFDEDVMEDLAWTRAYGTMLPVVEGWASPVSQMDSVVRVFGTEFIQDATARDYRFEGADGKPYDRRQFLEVWKRPNAVFFSKSYATARGWKVGTTLPWVAHGRTADLWVAGYLPDPEWMQGAGGAVAVWTSPPPNRSSGWMDGSRGSSGGSRLLSHPSDSRRNSGTTFPSGPDSKGRRTF